MLSLLLLFAGCSPKVENYPIFDGALLASPCTVENDSTWVIVKDYFPTIAEDDTVLIAVNGKTPFLSLLEVFSEGQKGTMVIRNNTPEKMEGCNTSRVPYITTCRIEGRSDAFILRPVNGVKELAVFWQNTCLSEKMVKLQEDSTFIVKIPGNARKMERSYIRAFAANENGVGNDVLIPLEYGEIITDPALLKRTDKQTQIIYSVLVDRFFNGNVENDWKINSPEVLPKVDYWGGDLAGITQKINEGWFDTVGVTTIWISPITQNPYDAWGQNENPKTKFTGYHGYWPIYITKVDKRFGTEDELRELLSTAHDDNKNVILDYVANHMHINSPTLKAHPDWVTSNVTPDGRPNFQLWDEFRLTTWFDRHIPSLNLENPVVCDQMTDSALYWMKNFEFDGFRHDATKHIPEGYWRMLTGKLLDSVPDRRLYQIGETYGSLSLINSYVKPGMLDAQFDFNVYDTYIWATTTEEGSFVDLSNTVSASLNAYGYHNLMGYITGNHDRARYVSIAGGALKPGEDFKLAGWVRDIDAGDPVSYSKLKVLHAMNMTLPGIPCIYYGDEYGQPGANDPDNRRWMRFGGYTADEQGVFECVKELAAMRKSSMPLLYGDYRLLLAERDIMAYMRAYMGDYVIVVLNRGGDNHIISLELPKGFEYNGSTQLNVEAGPYSYRIISNK